MRPWVRVHAYASLWTVVGFLTAGLVFFTAAAEPVARHIDDTALRQQLTQAPPHARDLVISQRVGESVGSAETVRHAARSLLPATVSDVIDAEWGIQRTRIRPADARSEAELASLAGDGVSIEPGGLLPLVTLHHQTDLVTAVTMIDGAAPATPPVTDDEPVIIEVMAAAAVAQGLGLTVGHHYQLLPGAAGVLPHTVTHVSDQAVTLRVSGVFTPSDTTAAIWQLDPRLLAGSTRMWPPRSNDPAVVQQATLVTDQRGIDALVARGVLPIENLARFTIDLTEVDATWAVAAREAIVALEEQPPFSTQLRLDTDLPELIDEFERQAVVVGTIAAMVTAGVIGTGIGLVILAAGITAARRRRELSLLRARGAGGATVVGQLVAEAALVVVPAATIGWLLHQAVPGRVDPQRLFGVGLAPVLVAVLALLTIPVTVTLTHRWQTPGSSPNPRQLPKQRLRLMRVTVELVILLLAGTGVLLLRQRGLQPGDAYLLSVPVLLALATGVVALRIYPWLLRMLTIPVTRLRGIAGFVGLAHAGRGGVTALLVLVLAVAVGSFAAGVHASIAAARDAAAVAAVGAHFRLTTEADLFDDDAVLAAETVPGVQTVAAAGSRGFLRIDGVVAQNITVVTLDVEAYQRILETIGAPRHLPKSITAAAAGADPIPALVPSTIRPDHTLTVEVHRGQEHRIEAVGDITGLPALFGEQAWVLVPRNALPQPLPVDDLFIAGAEADPAHLRAVVAPTADPDAVTVTSLTQYRKELDNSGFNDGITVIFMVGTAAAVLAGVLAIALALAGQAAHHRRTLSLLQALGMSVGQAHRLLLVELLPAIAAAVAAGAVVGAAMPTLLAPALPLTEFTDHTPVPPEAGVGSAVFISVVLMLFAAGGALWRAARYRSLPLSHILRT